MKAEPVAIQMTPSQGCHNDCTASEVDACENESVHDVAMETIPTIPLLAPVLSIFTGVSRVKRMVRKEDWTKIMFIYLCLFHVTPGQLCGASPLLGLQRLATTLGRDLKGLLTILRTRNRPAYELLERNWRNYMDCVALVDTGYF